MNNIICWWSGGVTSAVACKMAIDLFGIDSCQMVFIDTHNEHDDTYRFKNDCEDWYGKEIISVWNPKYKSIQEVWYKFLSLNVAHGAICSSELKREVRIQYEKDNPGFDYQVFGFDIKENNRALAMKLNYPKSKPIFPLLFHALGKKHCIKILTDAGLDVPLAYMLGYSNNNCLKTGCIQGGIGYWQKFAIDNPIAFNIMAELEHELTRLRGEPVTILKDQSKHGGLVFLKHNPDWPFHKDITMMKGRQPEPLMECNGFCGTNDLISVN